MAHYNANQIVENIEKVLEKEGALTAASQAANPTGRHRERRTDEPVPSTFRKLERAIFKVMRQHQAVDKVPDGSRLRFFKKLMSRALRLVSAPQATYNFQNLQALQLLASEIDALRERMRVMETNIIYPFGMVPHENSGATRLGSLVGQHLEQVQRNVGGITRNMEDMSQSLALVLDNLSAVANRLNQLGVTQRDLHAEVSTARLDASRLWTELGLVYESIDDRAEDLWKGLDERDNQLEKNTVAAQFLHNQTSSLETNIKELRARLLVLTEQMTIHQEMLETVQQEVKETSQEKRAPRAPHAREGSGTAPVAPSPDQPTTPSSPAPPISIDHQAGSLLQRQLDLAYLRFQRQYRGDENELRARQKEYITLLEANLQPLPEGGTRALLDVACGDGIFVELAAEHGWSAQGVDINEVMIKQGQQRGLKIEQDDAFAHLEKLTPKSYDVISMFQFVEHLSPESIMRLLKLSYRGLKPGGLILIETINPHTLKALHWFHLDLTHERLIFPEMLTLMAETTGFFSFEWKGINTVAEKERLSVQGSDIDKANIRKLNDALFGAQDYYFLGRRPTGQAT
ncbi:methyltransferase domain-containing protein [Candidatus Sumerlaeota bacterium]|nr:methyltransferase domain-containing protein [Candidatus Sumerlaeota bacterium]